MIRRSIALALGACAVLSVAPARPVPAAPPSAALPASAALSALDVIALEIGYTTVLARYYQPVEPARLLAGARGAIVAYLRGRGITAPAIPAAPARADRYRAESEIARDVALAIARYGSRVRTAELVERTIAGELAVLHDPYSLLFRPAEYKQFVGFLDGAKVGGIGAELDVDPSTHAVRVVEVFPGGPAEAAGVQAGDVIAAVDGAPPPAGPPAAVSAALRGRPGTVVRLALARDGAIGAPLAIVRAAVTPPDAGGRILPGGIGYLRLRSFGAAVAPQLAAALARLRGARAYVLDLRRNGGGYRDGAVAVASHFVRGTVVTTQERGTPPQRFGADAKTAPLGAPLAVLVDGDTASAAEIVAGAIQDERTGTLVGTRTFGKGLVQEIFPLPSGAAIKLTTARYLTPAGHDIDRVGITPDVTVAEPADAHPGEPGRDPQLDRALALLGPSP